MKTNKQNWYVTFGHSQTDFTNLNADLKKVPKMQQREIKVKYIKEAK